MGAPSASAVMPYLRSCEKECEKPIQGELKGEIPKWLKGCLIRVGSGLLQIGPDRFNHVFDGMALLHRFSFQDGNVTYQSRFLRSDSYQTNMRANRIVKAEFSTPAKAPDPCKTIFQRFMSIFDLYDVTDNDLVNIVMYSNEAYACSESSYIWKIDSETLESLEKVNLRDFVPTDAAVAHAHEGTDGTVYNIGSSYSYNSYYNVLRFPPKDDKCATPFDKGSVVCKIPVSKPFHVSYHHSFAMTDNYIIFVEQPYYLSVTKLTWAHFGGGSFDNAMHWDPDAQNIFHVVRRSDYQLLDTSYVAKSFFVFHHINAYEEDNHLVIDLVGYEKGEIVNVLYVKALEELFSGEKKNLTAFESLAKRYILPLNVDKNIKDYAKNLVTLSNSEATATLQPDGKILCTYEILTGSEPWSPELPRINYEKFNGKKYRYFYSIGRNPSKSATTHLIKVDVQNKKIGAWGEDGAIPSEPVFLEDPNQAKQDEDSGILLASLLYMHDESKVSLLVLNAKTMKEIGRVTFKTTAKVPGDFHGVFVPKV